MIVLDSHCDTPSLMIKGLDIGLDNKDCHVDIPKLMAGGVDASFFALFTAADLSPDAATKKALEMLASIYDAIGEYSGKIALAVSPDEILANKARGLISILVGMENGAPIQRSLSLLRLFYRMGVRYMTLTHNGDNEIADAAHEGKRWGGLSPFGREVVDEMNRIGMIIDVAHVSDRTFDDVLSCSKAPFVSTHSGCRAIASHPRNMSDGMIRAMADKGGVIQIVCYPVFLSEAYAAVYAISGEAALPRPSVEDVVRHIDHAVNVGGIDHVGIGTDFDGIEVTLDGLENISRLPVLFDLLSRRGYSDDQIEKIASGNFLRAFRDVISVSSGLRG
ncbi:MAG: dipeptidase [Bacteroidales bacterium]|nr:dipeptidase [Bacteroidales bacterium]